MARLKYKTYEEALAAQKALKVEVKNDKAGLTAYLKQNKLKRNVDHSDDKKHGKKIAAFQKRIDRAMAKLETTNGLVKDMKPKKERSYKYDYPDGLTAEEKKKFRQKARAESKPKKEKKAKKAKPAKAKKSKAKKSKKAKRSKKSKND